MKVSKSICTIELSPRNKIVVEEANSIDATKAQADLEKTILLVEEAATKKEKIEATIELRKCKARIQALAKS